MLSTVQRRNAGQGEIRQMRLGPARFGVARCGMVRQIGYGKAIRAKQRTVWRSLVLHGKVVLCTVK